MNNKILSIRYNLAILTVLIIFIFTSQASYSSENKEKQYDKIKKALKTQLIDKVNKKARCTTIVLTKDKNGIIGQGTGFYFLHKHKDKNYLYIITNKHVIDDAIEIILQFRLLKNNKEEFVKIKLIEIEKYWIKHNDNGIDICAFNISSLIDSFFKDGYSNGFTFLSNVDIPNELESNDILTANEEILMVGYPLGLSDISNNFPLFRKGITATDPNFNFNGKKEFVVDLPCFPGSSGSPIFLDLSIGDYDVLISGKISIFIGILYGGPVYRADGNIEIRNIPTKNEYIPRTNIPTNLGYAIKSHVLLDFLAEIEEGNYGNTRIY